MAQGGTLEYGISFNINKQNLDSLQKTLDEIIAKAREFEKSAPDYAIPYQEAAEAAKEFKNVLNDSWSPQLGRLDFSKVEKGLVNLYGSTKSFKQTLAQIGPESQKAFNQFTNAIVNTQAPLKQTNAMLDKLVVSFKNTIRYGISSAVWNNFANSVKQAYSYVKDLDKSLNSIRIVSGQSADQMERLAIQANKTAQELGKSTLDYTKAALIFYQQGLSGEDVTERTEVTLKMANVLGESAKEVSDYMTAIWNNFDQGSASLERYADVITALGASTAASSEEIATGMEKFAAVAKTIGLSYEYATSALATVVAQTRQSADTVGTAFRTIFARMEDLKLGKTLEDGTTLGKYSSTLEKIGVNIKDQTGQLKTMDTILSEMGAKWQTLSKDQQVAVAQGVAGIRQYTQLVALMDNWDSFEKNLDTALNSEGTLAQQQQIYLDSIEAHLQQLDTAWEGLYKNIFDEDALKALADALTKIINLANTFVTGLGGGLNSIMFMVMSLANMFSTDLTKELIRIDTNMKNIRENARETTSRENLSQTFLDNGGGIEVGKIGVKQYIEEQKTANQLLALSSEISDSDRDDLSIVQKKTRELREQNEVLNLINKSQGIDTGDKEKKLKNKESFKNLSKEEQQQALQNIRTQAIEEWDQYSDKERKEALLQKFQKREKANSSKIRKNTGLLTNIANKEGFGADEINELTGLLGALEKQEKSLKTIQSRLNKDKSVEAKTLQKELKEELVLRQRQINAIKNVQNAYNEVKEKNSDARVFSEDENEIVNAVQTQNKHLEYNNTLYAKAEEYLKKQKVYKEEIIQDEIKSNDKQIETNNNQQKAVANILEQRKATETVMNGFLTIGTTVSSLAGIIQTIKNPDIKGWEMWKSILAVGAVQVRNIYKNWDSIKKLLPALLKLTGSELTLETAIAKVKEQGVWASIKELALNIKNAVVEAIRALLHGKITGLAVALCAALAVGLTLLGKWIVNLLKGVSEEEKLKKRVEETGEAVKKASEAYQELKDKIADYNDAKKGLEGLKEGTVEFYEAVITANEKAQDLIDTLGLIAGQDYSIDASSGLININEKSLTGALTDRQQALFRTQATNTAAKLDLNKYYQREALADFTEAIFDKTGVIVQDAAKILDGTIGTTAEMFAPYGQWGKNITDEVAEFKAEYLRRSAEILAQQELLAAQLIQGYASQEDLKIYQSLSKEAQSLINKAISQQSIIADKDTDFEDKEEQAKKYILDNAESFKIGEDTLTTGQAMMLINSKDMIKRLYASDQLQWRYNESSEEWTDTQGHKRNIDDITYEEAIEGYSTGKQTKQSIDSLLDQVKKINQSEAIGKLNENSKDYVTEGTIALLTNQADKYNFSSMSAEEIDAMKNAYEEARGASVMPGGLGGLFAGYNEEYFEKLKENISIEARAAEDLKRYNDEIAEQATQLGISKNALKVYDTALQNATSDTIEYSKATARAAAETYEFNKNYNTGRKDFESAADAWKTYTKALEKNEDVSYDVADAVGKVLDDLEKMGITLTNGQLKDPKVLANIQKLFSGTRKEAEAAYQELEKLSIENMWDQWRAQVLKTKDFTAETIDELKANIISLNDGDLITGDNLSQFRKYIENAQMTYDELIQFLDANHIKYEIDDIEPVKVEKNEIPGSSTTQRHHLGKGNPYDPDHELIWDETITNLSSDFYTIGKKASLQKGSGKKTNFSPASSSSGKKSSGGSSSKPKTIDPVKAEADRYHEVNTQITKVTNSLKKLTSQVEKLVGKRLLENLNEQWKQLNIQIENYQEKLRIANGEQKELAKKLSAKGVIFNEDGTIGNYADAMFGQADVVNNLIAQYNKLSKAQQEAWDNKKIIENAKEAYEQFKTDLDRYDEVVSNVIPGIQQDILDTVDKQIELSIKKFNLKIEVTLDMTQATRDWNEWKKRAIDGIDPKDIFGNANAKLQNFFTYFNADGTGEIQMGTRHLNDLLEELRRMDENSESVYGDTAGNRAKALEDLKTYYTQLMQSITDVIELQDELHQDLLDEMSEIQSKFDEQIESYEYLSGVINHDLKVVQMIYGEDAYDTMDKFYNMQHENYVKELDFYRRQRDFWQEAMDRAEEGTEEWEAAKESMLAAEQGMEEVLVTGLENAKADLENAIGGIFKRLNNLITSGMGLDYVNEQWDLINKNADRYLDTINKTFGIRQLEQKYVDAINKTNNISVQQKLKKVMDEQLNNLKQRDRLTQYDLERANKMYEIELARIALQEAQMNKSQMRLRRDSQGNYTYQYVANRTAIEDAQAQLNDLYNSLYNFDKERYNSILNDAYSAWVEYQEKMADAAMITDPERRAQRELLIQQEYNEYMTQIEEDYQVSRYNLQESAFDDLKYLHNRTYEEMSDYERLLVMDEIVPTWNNGIQQMIEQFSGEGGFAELTKDSWKEMLTAQQEYANETKELETVSGQTYTTIADGLDKAIGLAKEFIERNDDLIKKYDVELDKVWDVYDQIIKLREEYEAQAKAAEEAAKKSYNYYQQELKLQQQLYTNAELLRNKSVDPTTESKDAKTYNNKNGATGGGGNSNGGGSSGGGGGGGITTKPTTTSTKATYTIMYYAKTNSGGNACVKNVKATEGSTHQVNYIPSSVSGYRFTGYFKNSSGKQLRNGDSFKVTKNETLTAQYEQIASMKPNAGLVGIAAGAVGAALGALLPFASGGYTGSWENNNGRLAVLHQKELVLNEADTKNMLNTVAIMRQISSSLGENTLARLAGATAQGYTSSSDSGLFEQNVHIDATFPNVQNSREIEEALNNLVNSASQRAMENKRR